jgi:hypothetical protein
MPLVVSISPIFLGFSACDRKLADGSTEARDPGSDNFLEFHFVSAHRATTGMLLAELGQSAFKRGIYSFSTLVASLW